MVVAPPATAALPRAQQARMAAEEKRLLALKATKTTRAEQLRQLRIAGVDEEFEAAKREAEEKYAHERGTLQDRLVQEVVERQKRTAKMEAPEIRAVTRKMRAMRGEPNPEPKAAKRDAKGHIRPEPLRQGEVEDDFEAMASLTQSLMPHLEVDLELDVPANKRLRPVESVRPSTRLDAPAVGRGAKRGKDFDFKGKSRSEVSGAKITVWYEEEHGGRKMDVPYVGVVNSCDPREGLYVKFDGW
jgi:hypothetical protein